MLFFYGICFYIEENSLTKLSNIIRHCEVINKLRSTYPDYKFKLIINCMINSLIPEERIEICDKIKFYKYKL